MYNLEALGCRTKGDADGLLGLVTGPLPDGDPGIGVGTGVVHLVGSRKVHRSHGMKIVCCNWDASVESLRYGQ